MFEDLTQEQQWGIMYLLKLANASREAFNATIADRNRMIPRDQPLLEEQPLLTADEFITMKLEEIANNGYQQLISFKEQEALRLFRSKTPEEQAALVAQLQIPDVLQ